MAKTMIRFQMVEKRGRHVVRRMPGWVSAVSWSDGTKVNKVSFTLDREKAARFSTATAYDVALQYSNSFTLLELADGTILEADTAKLVVEQQKRLQAYVDARARFAADWNDFLAGMDPALVASLRSLFMGRRF